MFSTLILPCRMFIFVDLTVYTNRKYGTIVIKKKNTALVSQPISYYMIV